MLADRITSPLGFWTPGPWEIVLILVVVLVLFGGKKLPELARGLARGMREFRSELRGTRKQLEDDLSEEEGKPSPGEESDKDDTAG
jgi:sec-independent protein translocase protein TatA